MKILKMFSIQGLFCVFLLVFMPFDCDAGDFNEFLGYNPIKITASEYKALPEYCQCKLYYNHYNDLRAEKARKSKKNLKLKRIFGSDYQHLHHFCWGLVKLERANAFNMGTEKRNFLLKSAVSEFDYVISRVGKNSPFLWMYHEKKGEALLLQNKNSEAQIEFLKAKFYKRRGKNGN